jgi:NAD(P)H-hydrate epimerase
MKTVSDTQINALYTGDGELPDAGCFLTEEKDIRPFIKQRKDSAHKGDFGHALLIAGSYGMAGASVLAARACMRSGVGLLTVHAPSCNNPILQIAIPEAMVEAGAHERCFAEPADTSRYNAVGIGPGLGRSQETEAALIRQLRISRCPLVLDADALNLLAANRHLLTALPPNSVLTPHSRELDRLTGESASPYERLTKARELAIRTGVHIVLKGHYSAVVNPGGKCCFNPTGNAGMATAGSGDVLTGIILALLAQGYTGEEAAKAGTYVHGMAGDLARRKYGVISLIAGDIIEFLPAAWGHISGRQTAGL